MTARRFAVAALAIVLHTAMNVLLLVTEAQNQWWIVVQIASTALVMAALAWAGGLLTRP